MSPPALPSCNRIIGRSPCGSVGGGLDHPRTCCHWPWIPVSHGVSHQTCTQSEREGGRTPPPFIDDPCASRENVLVMERGRVLLWKLHSEMARPKTIGILKKREKKEIPGHTAKHVWRSNLQRTLRSRYISPRSWPGCWSTRAGPPRPQPPAAWRLSGRTTEIRVNR